MAKREKKSRKNSGSGFVYSTNPDWEPVFGPANDDTELTPGEQKMRVWLERRGGGKVSTIVKDFEGHEDDLKEMGKAIKSACGTGGSVKNNEIIIQGDWRDKAVEWLKKEGYTQTKKAGGK